MFGTLSEKFQNLFSSLAGKKTLTEDNIADAVREVRLALLDADVNFSVVSGFIKRVKDKVLGDSVVKTVSAGEQFIKIIHDELVALMGAQEEGLQLKGNPTVILLCGLQGSGKTTQCAKLASFLRDQDKSRKVLMAACDLQRPAAIEQLKRLGSQAVIDVFSIDGESDPVKVAEKALAKAKTESYNILLVDTAGRLHVDEELMQQLEKIKDKVNPSEILFVASASTGQDAVKTAQEFDRRITITGSILTMLDGSSRAGAAISIAEVTKKPLKFEGVGEKIGDFQVFNPRSMADRILGMGDVINLVKKAGQHFSEQESKELEKKLRKATFTYDDYLKQMSILKKMGSFKSLLKMMPGMPNIDEMNIDDRELKKIEAMILSMTQSEREEKVELIPSRRRRIAEGSGVKVDDVNKMIKSFKRLKQFFKDMPSLKRQLLSGAGKKENFLWH
jgi:signal recognition particle subunit SRP54